MTGHLFPENILFHKMESKGWLPMVLLPTQSISNSDLSINRASIPRKASIFKAFELYPPALFP